MKLFVAGVATETNSFSPIPTGDLLFESTYLSRTPTSDPPSLFSAPLHTWREMGEALGWEVHDGLCTFAQPAGTTVRATYEAYRDEVLDQVRALKPDVVLYGLHGAMIADGYDDCEGDLLRRTREILGPDAVIGAELDLHNHLTDTMLDATDLIVGFKEYPHTDVLDRARELFDLTARTVQKEITPVMRMYDCRMIAMFHTTRPPMDGYVAEMQAREGRNGILSLSLSHGFPWGDSPDVGARMLAITDGDEDKAVAVAQEFGQKLWDLREAFRPDWPSIPEALDRAAAATETPVVLADFADNAGGGAPADSTFVLQEVLARGMKNIALGIYWDPVLVGMCKDAGVGSKMRVRLGGKVDVTSGTPVDLLVTVRGVKDEMFQQMGGGSMAMGTGIWLEADGVHMILSEKRTQAFNPTAFSDLGLDLSQLQAVVVKSSQHFHAGFAPIASEVIYINGPGAITPDYANIPYTKRDANSWPKVENPF